MLFKNTLLSTFAAMTLLLASCSGSQAGPEVEDAWDSLSDGSSEVNCSDTDDVEVTGDAAVQPPDHRIHFVLHTQKGWHPEGETYVLHARGKRYAMSQHTQETRAQHPDLFGAGSPLDDPPTHYVDGLDLPDDVPTRLHVTQRTDHAGLIAASHGDGADQALALVAIHIPEAHRRAALQRIADG